MRILILNWRDPSHPWAGGAEVFLYELAKRWAAGGHDVTWYSGRHPSQEKSGRNHGLRYMRRGGFFSVYLFAPIIYLMKILGHFDVIIDSANGIPFFSPLYSKTPKVALVHHIHEQVFYCELPRFLANIAAFIELTASPLIYKNTQFITVSDSSRRALVDIGVAEEKIELVFNGVDCDIYQPGRKSDTPLLVYLGRLRYYKSVDTAIRALPQLIHSHPDIKFCIAGSGPAKEDLQKLASEIGVLERVQFLGHVSEKDKVTLLQKAHVVVNPSLKEGWGLTVLEANACGTPVVGADVPGLRDSICHDKTGLLVPHGDHCSLAMAVDRLLGDPNQRQMMGAAARDWALKFDWDVSALKGMTILEQVVKGNKQ